MLPTLNQPQHCLLLQVPGTQAAFINYVVCLAVVRGIKQATQHLVQVSAAVVTAMVLMCN